MRAEALARRAADDTPSSGESLLTNIMRHIPTSAGAVVGCVWPLPGEPDLRPLLTIMHRAGCVVALPETPPRGEALKFRRWAPDCSMLSGRFGTSHPDGRPEIPTVMLVPLLAFDGARYRLGYGGGYYDRTLAVLSDCVSVGFGLAWQQVAEVPREPHDVALDMVVTEQGALLSSRAEMALHASGGRQGS